MRPILLFFSVVSLGFAPVPFPKSDANKQDAKKLQGAWVRVRVSIGGKVYSEAGMETTIVIAGDRMNYAVAGRPTNTWSFTLDQKTKPLLFDRKGLTGAATGLTYRGVYRLEADTFTLCSCDGNRPVDFAGTGPGVYIEVFKRKKP